MTSRLQQLTDQGVAVWVDSIARDWIQKGELRRLRDVPRFFLDAMRIHRQVRAADGALGVSLVAHPLRREFFTLSAWRDRAAVDAVLDPLDRCDVLIANAGGAFGADPVATGSADDWRAMYEVNVLGTLNTVQALLPKLIASGAGTIVVMGSTAGFTPYEGGGGYVAAKHGTHAMAGTLRLELSGQPVRVIEIDPATYIAAR